MTIFQNLPEKTAFPDSGHQPKTIYTVSELTERLKSLIEGSFPFVWVRGEISNSRIPASGHLYFTLKDTKAQIAAVIFRAQHHQLKFIPEDGMSIIGLGRLSVYAPRGSYQIILEYIEPAGLGALQIAFDRLKRRLSQEGFFDKRHKKPLPFLPEKISVATSPTGAVVHDVITVITRRFPNVHIEIVPTRVQGPGAEAEIVAALNRVNAHGDSDVIILARGGGSLEDLQAFNSESVAMAIFRSRIPVISAVGHETDFTIADFIADLRAPTPSAAAELVVPEKKDLQRRCSELREALVRRFSGSLQELQKDLIDLTRRMADPRRKIQECWLRIDDVTGRLMRLSSTFLRRERDRHAWLLRHLHGSSPRVQINKYNMKLDKLIYKNLINIKILIKTKQAYWRTETAKLESLNPLAILKRGYSVARTLPARSVILNPDQVHPQEEIEVLLSAGLLTCEVKEIYRYGEENI